MARQSDKEKKNASLMARISPPLAFAFSLCLLVILCYDSGYTSLPPTEKRYVAAKARIESLKDDSKKKILREPWEKLAAEFQSIYDSDPSWPNRPAALFRAAESLEELASRSCSKADARKAISTYETVALRHASSRLADDALLRAARIRAAVLRDDNGALALLARIKKQYPSGDMTKEAIALEKAIRASTKGKTAPEAISAASRNSREIQEDQPASKKNSSQVSGNLPLRMKAAMAQMQALKSDNLRACWRQPWEKLRDEFTQISGAGKNQIGPEASYYAASCQASLALCSHLQADGKKAVAMYAAMAAKYPRSQFADDALLNAAKLQRGLKDGKRLAPPLLDRLLASFPKGDKAGEAAKLRAAWREEDSPAIRVATAATTRKSSAEKSVPAELQVLSWDSPGKNNVEITLELSGPVKYSARLQEPVNGSLPRVLVDLPNASVINDIRRGVTVQGSLLKAVRVRDLKGGGATLQFDFREVRHFNARMADDPCRIILSVAAVAPKAAPASKPAIASSGKKQQTRQNPDTRLVSNMASQLGLTVQRVFIDAGHGGKDPGTSHNNVVEREAALDVALRLGRLLKANGMEVVFSRERDKAVPLSHRGRLANASKADLFISIHVNAHTNPDINGIETYYLNLANNKHAAQVAMLENVGSDRRLGDMQGMLAEVMLNARVDESRRLADDVQRLSIFRLKKRNFAPRDNGVKSAPFHVLIGTQMPAVLVELGYCTNAAEARSLASPQYRHALAEGLAEGILAYKNRLLKNRTAGSSLTPSNSDAI